MESCRAMTSRSPTHLDTLGERAITYKDEATLRHALLSFDRNAAAARGAYWNAYREFEPSEVMRTFSRVLAGDKAPSTPDSQAAAAAAETPRATAVAMGPLSSQEGHVWAREGQAYCPLGYIQYTEPRP